MMATAGVLFTAAIGLPQWYEAGEKALESTQLITYISVSLMVFLMVFLMMFSMYIEAVLAPRGGDRPE